MSAADSTTTTSNSICNNSNSNSNSLSHPHHHQHHHHVRKASSMTPKSSPMEGVRRSSPNELFPSFPRNPLVMNHLSSNATNNNNMNNNNQQQQLNNIAANVAAAPLQNLNANNMNALGNSNDCIASEDDMSRLLTATSTTTAAGTNNQTPGSGGPTSQHSSPNTVLGGGGGSSRISLRPRTALPASSAAANQTQKKNQSPSSLFLRPTSAATATVPASAATAQHSTAGTSAGSSSAANKSAGRLVLRKKTANDFPKSPLTPPLPTPATAGAAPAPAPATTPNQTDVPSLQIQLPVADSNAAGKKQQQLATSTEGDEDAAVPAPATPHGMAALQTPQTAQQQTATRRTFHTISPTPNPIVYSSGNVGGSLSGVPPAGGLSSSTGSGLPTGESGGVMTAAMAAAAAAHTNANTTAAAQFLPASPSGPSPAGTHGGGSFPIASFGVMSLGSRVPPVSTPTMTPGPYTPSPLTTGGYGTLSSHGSVEGAPRMPRHSKLRIPLPSLDPLVLPTLTEQPAAAAASAVTQQASSSLSSVAGQRPGQQGCQLLTDLYHMEAKVGEGTYGEVCLGRCKRTDKRVAIKRLKVLAQLEGIPVTSLREVFILKFISNGMPLGERRYFALLKDICVSPDLSDTFLVFEFVEHSLFGLAAHRFVFRDNDIAFLFKQLVEALRILHAHQVIHRDIKPNNILINTDGSLKLCDFGLAFSTTNLRDRLTPSLIVLDYRPPEMLLGSRKYDAKVDVWSVGCLLAQMYLGFPPFSQRAMQSRQQQQQRQNQQQSRAVTELEQLKYMGTIYKVPVADTLTQESFELCTDYSSSSSTNKPGGGNTPRPDGNNNSNNSGGNKTQRSAVGCMIKRSPMAAVPEIYSANCLRATGALRTFIEETSLQRQKRRPPPNALAVIVACLHPEPTERPTMQQLGQYDFFNVPSEVRRDLAQRLGQLRQSLHSAPPPPGVAKK